MSARDRVTWTGQGCHSPRTTPTDPSRIGQGSVGPAQLSSSRTADPAVRSVTGRVRGRRRRSTSETHSPQADGARSPGLHRRRPRRRHPVGARDREARVPPPESAAHRQPGGEAHPGPALRAGEERHAEQHRDRAHPRPRRQGEAGRQGRRQGQRRHRPHPLRAHLRRSPRPRRRPRRAHPAGRRGDRHRERHLQQQAHPHRPLDHPGLHQVGRRDQGPDHREGPGRQGTEHRQRPEGDLGRRRHPEARLGDGRSSAGSRTTAPRVSCTSSPTPPPARNSPASRASRPAPATPSTAARCR